MTNCTNLLPCRDTHHVTLAVECHFPPKVGLASKAVILFLYYRYRLLRELAFSMWLRSLPLRLDTFPIAAKVSKNSRQYCILNAPYPNKS